MTLPETVVSQSLLVMEPDAGNMARGSVGVIILKAIKHDKS